jgi:hypothetical protein
MAKSRRLPGLRRIKGCSTQTSSMAAIEQQRRPAANKAL